MADLLEGSIAAKELLRETLLAVRSSHAPGLPAPSLPSALRAPRLRAPRQRVAL